MEAAQQTVQMIPEQEIATHSQIIRSEAKDLKEVVAEQTLELRLLKKSMFDGGGDPE